MIHLYHGPGKGKTTAAMGLALRMAGRGRQVVIAQFLKSSDSGERNILSRLPNIHLLEIPEQLKFSFRLTPQEQLDEQRRYRDMLEQASQLCAHGETGLLVLDEVCDGVNAGLVSPEQLLECLDQVQAEIVITGRNPHPKLTERADYITFFAKERHPFDSGIPAREGVEY